MKSFLWSLFSVSTIFLNSYEASSFKKSFENREAIDFWSVSKNVFFDYVLKCLYLFFSLIFICFCLFFPWSSIVFLYNAFSKGEYVDLACSATLLWSNGNISAPVGYSYLLIFPDCNADTFTASLLISYCNFYL